MNTYEILMIVLAIIAILILSSVIKLNKNDKEDMTVVTMHKTDWCPHCNNLKPHWNNVKAKIESKNKDLADNEKIVMKENDEDKNRTPGITGYPTIIKDVDGKKSKFDHNPQYTIEASLEKWIKDEY